MARGGGAGRGLRITRIAVFILAALVFAAGLILDTGALLELVGGFLRDHAVTVAAIALLLAAMAVGLARLRGRKGAKKRARAGPKRRSAGPRQQRAGAGREQGRIRKNARGG